MKNTVNFLLALLMLTVFACTSTPEPIPKPEPVSAPVQPTPAAEPPAQVAVVVPPEEPVFNPESISQAERDQTKADLQKYIEELNKIIRAKNYKGWVSHLGNEYFQRIGSKEFLDSINNQPRMKTAGIALKSANDYFTRVVVPSHANDHIDDIEMISQTRVKAYTINAKEERLVLYDLEKTADGWKIMN